MLMQAVEKANCSTRALPRLLWRKALSEDDGRSRVTSNALRITQVAPKTCMAVMRSRSRNTASSRTKTLLTRRKGASRESCSRASPSARYHCMRPTAAMAATSAVRASWVPVMRPTRPMSGTTRSDCTMPLQRVREKGSERPDEAWRSRKSAEMLVAMVTSSRNRYMEVCGSLGEHSSKAQRQRQLEHGPRLTSVTGWKRGGVSRICANEGRFRPARWCRAQILPFASRAWLGRDGGRSGKGADPAAGAGARRRGAVHRASVRVFPPARLADGRGRDPVRGGGVEQGKPGGAGVRGAA